MANVTVELIQRLRSNNRFTGQVQNPGDTISVSPADAQTLYQTGYALVPGFATQTADTATALAALQAVVGTKQDATTAATDAEVATVQAALQTLISAKQDASTAATDTELAAHAADPTLHSSGQRVFYAKNELALSDSTKRTTLTTTLQDVAQLAGTLPVSTRPILMVARLHLAISGTPAVNTVGAITAVIAKTSDGTYDGGTLAEFYPEGSGTGSGNRTLLIHQWVQPGDISSPTDYKVQINRNSATNFAAYVMNGTAGTVWRSEFWAEYH